MSGQNSTSVNTAPAKPESDRAWERPTSHLADYHRLCLVLAVGVLLLAALLRVRPDQRVAFGLFPGLPLPEVCQSKVLLGLECPGCGLTRSFIHLAHGNLASSFAAHRLGWLVALLVAAQIPYRLWALRSASGTPLGERVPWTIAITTIVLLIANWITRLFV
jgi:hypothetical protein